VQYAYGCAGCSRNSDGGTDDILSIRHSRYDQYQSERYGTMSNRHANVPSSQQVN
ncbi:unnamed protein product, partial [Rotaria sp. Silwood2]